MSAKVRLAFERAFDANTSCVRKQPCFAVPVRRGGGGRVCLGPGVLCLSNLACVGACTELMCSIHTTVFTQTGTEFSISNLTTTRLSVPHVVYIGVYFCFCST